MLEIPPLDLKQVEIIKGPASTLFGGGTITGVINFENFTDTRKSHFKIVANGPHGNPTFDDIWTHTEGLVINGGIKVQL